MLGPRLRLIPAAFAAALIALALALPAAASAVEVPLTIDITGEGAVGCEVELGPLEECEVEYEEGTDVTVIAEPELGSEFVEWSGECDSVVGGECEVEMDAPRTIEVVFELEEFELTIETEGNGEGAVECQVEGGPYELCPESETYPYGTEVILFAEPEEGSEFVEWSGDCSGIEAECELTVEEPLGVTATFAPEPPFELTIETGGTGSGTVECEVEGGGPEECESEYEEGTELVLVAVANAGSSFAGFSAGGGSAGACSTSPCTFTIEVDSAVTATFNLIPRTLTITKAGTGTGGVKCKVSGGPEETCPSPIPNGESVQVIATPDAGSEFKGFSAGSGSAAGCTSTPCTFTIEATSAVTATFDVQSGGGGGGGSETGGGGSSGGGTGGGGGGGTVAGTATVAGAARVKSGKAALKLRCSGGPCQGTLKLTAKVKQGKKTKSLVIGKASFNLAAGASATLKVKLSAPAKRELAKGKTIKAKLSGTGVAAATVKLKPAKKK